MRFLSTFYQLVRTELVMQMDSLYGKWIDVSIWAGFVVFVYGYILPSMGMASNYAALLATTAIVSTGVFDMFGRGAQLIADYHGDRTLTYRLTLPTPMWTVVASMALSRAFFLIAVTSIMLPIQKLVLGSQLDLSNFMFGKFLLALVSVNLMSGFFVVWASSIPKNLDGLFMLWKRLVFPLWWMGGAIFPYFAFVKAFPSYAWIGLINPFVYANEVMRYAVLGPVDTLPFWSSLGVIWAMVVFFAWHGTVRLRRLLDAI